MYLTHKVETLCRNSYCFHFHTSWYFIQTLHASRFSKFEWVCTPDLDDDLSYLMTLDSVVRFEGYLFTSLLVSKYVVCERLSVWCTGRFLYSWPQTEKIVSKFSREPPPVADLGGGAPGARPPYGPKFSRFHAVFRKIWQNRMLAPPPRGLAPPPTGNPGSAPALWNFRPESPPPPPTSKKNWNLGRSWHFEYFQFWVQSTPRVSPYPPPPTPCVWQLNLPVS